MVTVAGSDDCRSINNSRSNAPTLIAVCDLHAAVDPDKPMQTRCQATGVIGEDFERTSATATLRTRDGGVDARSQQLETSRQDFVVRTIVLASPADAVAGILTVSTCSCEGEQAIQGVSRQTFMPLVPATCL